jgi:tRNA pseudouridine55 synthase
MHGLLVIDKPGGITSRDAVNRAQRWLPPGTRLGHTGTLDPLATGVLVLCIGHATRLAEYVQRMPKTYEASILLGAHSDTDDADGTVTPAAACTVPTAAQVTKALQCFVGTIDQVPPAYSAAKVTGRRAYALARRGDAVSLVPRPVTIHAIDLVHYEFPRLDIVVRCSRGTYIRSVARDLGARLGCGGYIVSLRRTRVGSFDAAAALSLDADAAAARAALRPMALAVAELPRRMLTAAEAARVRHGQPLPLSVEDMAGGGIALFDDSNRIVAIGTIDRDHGTLRPGKVFPD